MEELNQVIGKNLGNLRRSKNLSLGQLAELCGLSKVLLSQIEKGNSNPTIQTIWKIAGGLKVPYTALIDAPQDEHLLVRFVEARRNAQTTADPRCTIHCYYPLTGRRNFEAFGMRFEPGGGYASPGHPEKSVEYIFIETGQLLVLAGGQEYSLQAGDSLSFAARQEHEYRNDGKRLATALCINWYAP